MADVAGYGHYSAQDEFAKYFQQLEETALRRIAESRRIRSCPASGTPATNRVKTRLLVYTPQLLDAILKEQFEEKNWPNERRSPQFSEYFSTYKRFSKPDSYKEFLQDIKVQDLDFAATLDRTNNTDVKFVSHRMPLYMWMHDSAEAVFVFTYHETKTGALKEIPFRTSDRALISVFQEIFDREWKDASTWQPKWGQK